MNADLHTRPAGQTPCLSNFALQSSAPEQQFGPAHVPPAVPTLPWQTSPAAQPDVSPPHWKGPLPSEHLQASPTLPAPAGPASPAAAGVLGHNFASPLGPSTVASSGQLLALKQVSWGWVMEPLHTWVHGLEGALHALTFAEHCDRQSGVGTGAGAALPLLDELLLGAAASDEHAASTERRATQGAAKRASSRRGPRPGEDVMERL